MMHVADHQLLLFPPVRPLAERFGADFFRAVPERPGVYLMSTARDGVLYVGKAKNLRRRLASYRAGTADRLSRKLTRLLLRVERIDWDESPNESAALTRERELIRALQPRFNIIGVRPPKSWFIAWQQRRDTLTLALDESATGWLNARGPFVFVRPAFVALLRSLWRKLHPGASVSELPSRLLTCGSGPTRWNTAWSETAAEWLNELESFLDGGESRLLPSIIPAARHLKLTPAPRRDAEITSRLRIKSEGASPVRSPDNDDGQDIPAHSPPPLTFDEQWQARDDECLAEFHERLHPSLTSS